MKKICIRVDANSTIGQGHTARCYAIASALKNRQVDVYFAVSDMDSLKFFEGKNENLILLNCNYLDFSLERAEELVHKIKSMNMDAVLIDSYFANEKYIEYIKKYAWVATFWCYSRVIETDLLINYNVNYNKEFYQKEYAELGTELLLGTRYVPLRKEFSKNKIKKINQDIKNVLVLTGGSDSLGIANSIYLNYKLFFDYNVKVVVGKYSPFINKIDKDLSCGMGERIDDNTYRINGINYMTAVEEIYKYMVNSDVVVTAGGTTVYELCALGVPAVVFAMADNQIGESEYLGEKKIVKYIGDVSDGVFEGTDDSFVSLILNALEEISPMDIRKNMSEKMLNMVDGRGCERIVEWLLLQ